MKLKDIIKKQTLIIVLTVAIVTITTLGVSYAVFFDVKKNSEDQVITAGSLEATISDMKALTPTEVLSDADGLNSPAATYTIKNTNSTLPAKYSLCVFAKPDNTIELNTIKLSTNGTSFDKLVSDTRAKNEAAKTDDNVAGKDCYIIDEGTVAAGETLPQKSIRIWVSSELYGTDGEGIVSLSLFLDVEVDEVSAGGASTSPSLEYDSVTVPSYSGIPMRPTDSFISTDPTPTP